MSFYTFRQNNSGGFYDGFPFVIIEASSPVQANELAQDYGVYFNGVEQGRDCPCCGDRWYTMSESDASDIPTVYDGREVAQNDPDVLIVWA
jgi:hypothetical protein